MKEAQVISGPKPHRGAQEESEVGFSFLLPRALVVSTLPIGLQRIGGLHLYNFIGIECCCGGGGGWSGRDMRDFGLLERGLQRWKDSKESTNRSLSLSTVFHVFDSVIFMSTCNIFTLWGTAYRLYFWYTIFFITNKVSQLSGLWTIVKPTARNRRNRELKYLNHQIALWFHSVWHENRSEVPWGT